MKLSAVALTISEAAYVAGLTVRSINHEIDEKIIEPTTEDGTRRVGGADLLYLGAIKNVRTGMGHALRQRFRAAIVEAARAARHEAQVDCFSVALDRIERALAPSLDRLRQVRDKDIESLPNVLAGEPVIKGTRIAARHVSDLVKHGASAEEVAEDLELTRDQVEAALIFDRVTPRLGRPVTRKVRIVDVSAA